MVILKKKEKTTPEEEVPAMGEQTASSAEATSQESPALSTEENTTLPEELSTNIEDSEPTEKVEDVKKPVIGYLQWVKNTITSFLDIADISSLHDRRAAIVSLKKDEDALISVFDLAESFLTVEYTYACEIEDKAKIEMVELYRGKAITLKKQMGLIK